MSESKGENQLLVYDLNIPHPVLELPSRQPSPSQDYLMNPPPNGARDLPILQMETLMCKGRNWLSMEVCDPNPRVSNHYPLLPVGGDVSSPAGSLLR